MYTPKINLDLYDLYISKGWLGVTRKNGAHMTYREVEDVLEYAIRVKGFHKLGIKVLQHKLAGKDVFIIKKKHLKLLSIYDEYEVNKDIKLTPYNIYRDLAVVYRGSHPRLIPVGRYDA